jgi:hypothetical protein
MTRPSVTQPSRFRETVSAFMLSPTRGGVLPLLLGGKGRKIGPHARQSSSLIMRRL